MDHHHQRYPRSGQQRPSHPGSDPKPNPNPYTHAHPNSYTQAHPDPKPQLKSPGTVTLISAVQGSGTSSPLINQKVTVRGVVIGDFQAGLGGYFVQDGGDGNSATSDGIFVVDATSAVAVGDLVQITATVAESYAETQLQKVSAFTLCASGQALPAPVVLSQLPSRANNVSVLEPLEGMLVQLSGTVTVSEVYNLGHYAELQLSTSGRNMAPTQVTTPGTSANNLLSTYQDTVILDDSSNTAYPDPIVYPSSPFSYSNTVRVGDTVSGLVGPLGYDFGTYRIQPTLQLSTPVFTRSKPRTSSPAAVGGTLQVAAMNVLNYFHGPTFPTSRGATTLEEFNRQSAKIVSAITDINPAVCGLMEIENDGYGSGSAIQSLLDGLNSAAGFTKFATMVINPGVVGTDAISVKIIYQPALVQMVGSPAILNSSVNPEFIDTKSRPSIAQTFVHLASSTRFNFVVNHLKSKGSSCTSCCNDPDTGDGSGNCNGVRTKAADALGQWLATDPTGSGSNLILVVGDMNSYHYETPIQTLINAYGYTDMVQKYVGLGSAHSFVFQGLSGYLDHALASPAMVAKITGVTEWHINCDEPPVLDYNEENKDATQLSSYYSTGPFRASDHDPVVIGLGF